MRTREQYEDIIQRNLCTILPKMSPQDIRPAYQQQDMAGKVYQTDDSSYEYLPFTPADNFIYIQVKISNNPIGPYVSASGDVEITNSIEAKLVFYGSQSSQLAQCVYGLFGTDSVISAFEKDNLIYQYLSGTIEEIREIINEQWYERHEFTVYFDESVKIKTPFKTVIVGSLDNTNIRTITHENNTKIGEDVLA